MWVFLHRAHLRSWGLRGVFAAGVLGCGGLCAGRLVPEPQAHAATPAQVSVAGERVELGQSPRLLAERQAHSYLAAKLTVRAGSVEQHTTRRALGARVDTEHLAKLLAAAGDASSPLRRIHARALGARPLQLPMPSELDIARAEAFVTRLKDLTDTPALEPRLDPRTRVVSPARDGVELDVYGTLDRIDAALRTGSPRVQAAMRAVAPRQATAALEQIELGAVLGEFETRYNRSSGAEDRTHNLKVAAAKLDGFVIEPGATFDFNAAVGGRSELNGFRPAPVIADGELVDGLGGGTCQIASTLHAAALFAALPIVTRTPHSRPSYYIRLGLDATVVYGAQNLRFANDRPYPVVIGLTVDDGRVHATLHGRARDRTVIFMRHIDTIVPFEERTIADRTLPAGVRVLEQRGIPGFEITRVRVVRDAANQQDIRERSTDSYPPTAQVWRVGLGPEARPNFERPRNDPHPEYVADEFLQMTQNERGTLDIIREAGRTGDSGWTEREGLVLRKSSGS